MKKKIFIQANCQGQAIAGIVSRVPRLAEVFETLPIKPVHLWKQHDEEYLFGQLKECDVFLHQPVSNAFGGFASEKLLEMIPDTANSFSFPVLFFAGYNPETVYLKNEQGQKVQLFSDYHDVNILAGFLKGLTVSEIHDYITTQGIYTRGDVEKIKNDSIQALTNREQNLTIKVSDKLSSKLSTRLFFSMNHPTNELLYLVVDEFLSMQGIEKLSDEEKQKLPLAFLGQTRLYVYPDIKAYYGFEQSDECVMNKQTMALKQVIENYYDIYKDNITIIKYNVINRCETYSETQAVLIERILG